jgi:hypothetical protein
MLAFFVADDLDLIDSARVELRDEEACDSARETGRVSDGSDMAIGTEVGGVGRDGPFSEFIEDFLDGNSEYPMRPRPSGAEDALSGVPGVSRDDRGGVDGRGPMRSATLPARLRTSVDGVGGEFGSCSGGRSIEGKLI